MTVFEEYMLRRTGMAPLRFRGALLAESDGERQGGKEHNRWHSLRIYRTEGNKYIVCISFSSRWQGELGHNWAVVLDRPEGVTAALRGYDPAAHVQGYPPGPQYAERQARLLADLRRRHDAQVSEVLAARPEFAEAVA